VQWRTTSLTSTANSSPPTPARHGGGGAAKALDKRSVNSLRNLSPASSPWRWSKAERPTTSAKTILDIVVVGKTIYINANEQSWASLTHNSSVAKKHVR